MKKFGLIGYPLGHSFSKGYFTDKFENERIDAEYVNFEIPDIDLLPDIIKNEPDLVGLNITIPYKESVIDYLDDISEGARIIGAVNCIRIDRSSEKPRLVGYNTDVIGFRQSLEQKYHSGMQQALILGTGGASKAVAFALASMGIAFKYVSRNPDEVQLSYVEASAMLPDVQLVVNTTPVGMHPTVDECPPLTYELFNADHFVYDLVYNPEETLFMKKAQEQGASTKNGLEMLERQAEAGWEIWNERS